MEVEFKVAQDIFIGNNSIPQGTSAIGKVVKATKGKSWGRAGKLSIEIDRLVLANNTPLKLKAPNIEKEGFQKNPMGSKKGECVCSLECDSTTLYKGKTQIYNKDLHLLLYC